MSHEAIQKAYDALVEDWLYKARHELACKLVNEHYNGGPPCSTMTGAAMAVSDLAREIVDKGPK